MIAKGHGLLVTVENIGKRGTYQRAITSTVTRVTIYIYLKGALFKSEKVIYKNGKEHLHLLERENKHLSEGKGTY